MVFPAHMYAMWGGALGYPHSLPWSSHENPTVTLCRPKKGGKTGRTCTSLTHYIGHTCLGKDASSAITPTGSIGSPRPMRVQAQRGYHREHSDGAFQGRTTLFTWPIQEKSARDPWRREVRIQYICNKSAIPNAAYSPRSPRWREFSGCSIHCPPPVLTGNKPKARVNLDHAPSHVNERAQMISC